MKVLSDSKHVVLYIVFLFMAAAFLFPENKDISFSAEQMSGSARKSNSSTVLEGHAVVTVGSLRISGDRIELSGKDYRFVSATGTVEGTDEEKGFSFTAEELSYDRDLEVATFRGNVTLDDSKHDVESSAGLIMYNQKTEVAYLQADVKLKRKNIDCTSNFALYRRTISMLELSGNPEVVRDGDLFQAERITVNLETEHIALDGSVSGTLKETENDTANSEQDDTQTLDKTSTLTSPATGEKDTTDD